jgi:dihydropteroate synthase
MSMPHLMGILNVTPDSFFDKGSYFSLEKAVERGVKIWKEGADIIDVGGASSRPFAEVVSEEEELRRVIPVIEQLVNVVTIPISIDTSSPKVARLALEKGARFLNSISGFLDEELVEVAACFPVDLCLMHMQGTPQTMQLKPSYPEGVVPHILHFFEQQIEKLLAKGVKRERIILDPGIGFGKSVEHNLILLKSLHEFKKFGLRILIGASRKSFMAKILGKETRELLPATCAIHTIALFTGADIIRAHDIPEHRDILNITSQLL